MSVLINLNPGSPTIFLDSHPSEQDSYLYSYWSSLKEQLYIAWSGDAPKFHKPGRLRIIWYTHDGYRGFKDYELYEFALVRKNFDALLDLDEVRRVVIMGYSEQNPYTIGPDGRNSLADRLEKNSRKVKLAEGFLQKKGSLQATEKSERIDDDESNISENLIDLDDVTEIKDREEI
jgi:hypothetical protein